MHPADFIRTLTPDVLDGNNYLAPISRNFEELKPAIKAVSAAMVDGDYQTLVIDKSVGELLKLMFGSTAYLTSTELLSKLENILRGSPGTLEGIVFGLLIARSRTSNLSNRGIIFHDLIRESIEKSISGHQDLRLVASTRIGVNVATRESRHFDFVILKAGAPLAAVEAIFQTIAGGRNQREFYSLVELQDSLAQQNVGLIVVADGSGFRQMATMVHDVGNQLRYLSNLHGLENGELSAFVNELELSKRPLPIRSDATLFPVVDRLLRDGTIVTNSQFGFDWSEMENFLLRYESLNPDIELTRPDPGRLTTKRDQTVKAVRGFSSTVVIDEKSIQTITNSVHGALGWSVRSIGESKGLIVFSLDTDNWRLRMPNPTPVFWALDSALGRKDVETNARELLSQGPIVGRIGILLSPYNQGESTSNTTLPQELAGQVVNINADTIVDLLIRTPKASNALFTEVLLGQVDISLVSPFLSEGPTNEVMFYGREPQIRQILEQIRVRSFALVGGRRAGKTSLLHGLRRRIPENIPVRMLDCQAHPTRLDFLSLLLQDSGKVTSNVPDERFTERAIQEYVSATFGDEFGIILLDEVDNLFESDATASEYPHLLSSALRSLVQNGKISVVVTGERTLHRLTLDPSSPHWNFCTPIQVGPLEAAEAERLMSEPLADLLLSASSEATARAVEACALHPNLVQFFGTQIVNRMAAEDYSSRVVGLEIIEEIADSPEFHHRFVTTFWSRSSPLEKLLSTELSFDKPLTTRHLLGQVLDYGIDVQPTELDDALSYLTLYSIARETTSGFTTRSIAFDRYMRALHGLPIHEEMISEVGVGR